jgi:hypothetical protein
LQHTFNLQNTRKKLKNKCIAIAHICKYPDETPKTHEEGWQHHSKKDFVDIMLFFFSRIGSGVGFASAVVLAWGISLLEGNRGKGKKPY